MSIIIHIPRIQNENSIYSINKQADLDEVYLEEHNEVDSINIPKHNEAKANDLSRFEDSNVENRHIRNNTNNDYNTDKKDKAYEKNMSHMDIVNKILNINDKNSKDKDISNPSPRKSVSDDMVSNISCDSNIYQKTITQNDSEKEIEIDNKSVIKYIPTPEKKRENNPYYNTPISGNFGGIYNEITKAEFNVNIK